MPGRMADRPTQRVLSWLVLGAAFAVACVSLLSADVVVRVVGIGVMALGGVAASLFAWRSADRLRDNFADRSTDQLRAFGVSMHRERSQHLRVLRIMGERNADLTRQVRQLAVTQGALRQQVSTLRGNNESLRLELEMSRTMAAEAEILTLPRRAASTTDRFSATELWSAENSPTVVDLQAMAAPFVNDALANLA